MMDLLLLLLLLLMETSQSPSLFFSLCFRSRGAVWNPTRRFLERRERSRVSLVGRRRAKRFDASSSVATRLLQFFFFEESDLF